jgi:hypothetical protein
MWGLAIVGGVAAIVGLDLTVMSLLSRHELGRQLFVFDPHIGPLHRPHVDRTVPWPEASGGSVRFRTDALGLREDRSAAPPRAVRRVLVFGDSHTDGVVSNAASFPNIAEARLEARGRSVHVDNAGVGYFSLYQQLLLFRRLLDLRPEGAVFTLYTGNDWYEILRSPTGAYLEERGGAILERPPAIWTGWAFRLRAHSLIGRGAVTLWRRWLGSPDAALLRDAARVSAPVLWQSLTQARYFTQQPEEFQRADRLHRYVVQQILDTATERGVAVLFVLLPTKIQVEPGADREAIALLERRLQLGRADRMDAAVRQAFTRIVEEQPAELLDPLDAFRAASRDSGELYWRRDYHLGERGHRLLGELLAARLEPLLEGAHAAGGRPPARNGGPGAGPWPSRRPW